MAMNNLKIIYDSSLPKYKAFLASVETYFREHSKLNSKPLPIIHSIKSRVKEFSHIEEKLVRKEISIDSSLFPAITDVIGIRILHLHQKQFEEIHNAIMEQITSNEWCLHEQPKAYTWDPEYQEFYKKLNIETQIRDTYYTSIHYLITPNNSNPNRPCCEIQVRTLFEEIWGEIDHTINYPRETQSIACKEQLRVLSKLVSTGTRLADSIFKSYDEYTKYKED